jgi:phage gpG-like protein
MSEDAVRIEGLAELRRDLRQSSPEVRRDVTRALKEGAKVVAVTAAPLTARQSGKLAGGWRPGAAGNSAFVRNRVPYAGVLEFGGRIAPKGTPFTIRAHPAGTRALQLRENQIVEAVGDAVEGAFARHGFR